MKALTSLHILAMYKELEIELHKCILGLDSSNLWIPPYKDPMSWTWPERAQGKAATRLMHMFQEFSVCCQK